VAIEIREVGPEALEQYARVPMTFRVESILHVEEIDGGLGGLRLAEAPVDTPYVRDYDDDPDEAAASWVRRFDVSNWLFLMAFDAAQGEAVGGATVAFRSPKVHMLQGRDDLAVLWDIRVHPDYRGRGIGTGLFDRAAAWARQQGCKQLNAETQNVNIPACRFYAARGCRLGAIDRYGYANYPRLAHEVMLLWCLDL
jgi:GNAT superfamily N-acetyltransferase